MTIMKKILFTICVFTFVSCSSNNDFQKGKKQLEQQGYTDVKNTGYEVFCCGKDDTFSTGFEAKDKNGKIVKGCFCSQWLKGLTIRFE
jgi:hypothetical protein